MLEYDAMLCSTLNDIDLVEERVQEQLNETLERENAGQITEFVFDGPEDINVHWERGEDKHVFEICSETSMDDLMMMILSWKCGPL